MRIFIIISVFLCLLSCKDDQYPENSKIINIDVDKSVRFFEAEKLLDTIGHSIIKLDTTNNSIIGNIAQLRVYNEHIYILDDVGKVIWIYDLNGNYVSKISAKGKAKNEYIDIQDFCVSDNNIYILDNFAMKLLIYNNNGFCIKTLDIKNYWANSLFVIKDDIFLYNQTSDSPNGKYHIFKIDNDGNLLNSYLKFDIDYGIGQDLNRYSKINEEISICLYPDNLIYRIDSAGCKLAYSVNFVNKNLPEKYYENNLRSLIKHGVTDRFVLGVDKFQESDYYIFISFWYKSEYYTAIYNKINEVVEVCRGILVSSFYKMGFGKYFIQDGYVYEILEAGVFKAIFNEIKSDNNIDNKYILEINEANKTLSDNSNPIIIRYKMKSLCL